jgi:polyferredoxin
MATLVEPPQTGTTRTPTAHRSVPQKKKLIRRRGRDRSQRLRHIFQGIFLALNLYLGTLFYFWVRQFEGSAHGVGHRPPGVEGWLPIAGMMNFKYWVLTGKTPPVHPAAMVLLITFVAIAFLFRKAFCSWLCPVGTISEALASLGRKLFRRNFILTRWLDIPLRGLKYFLLGFFLWAVSSMSTDALSAFMRSPYGLIADVKMLNFFRHMGETGLIVMGVLVVASVLVQNFWCRYLCPYGALLGLASLLSPLGIRRSPSACIDCGKCKKACPANLRVDELITIKSAECTGCLECVAACPAEGALGIHLPELVRRKPVPAWAIAAGVTIVFYGVVGYAKISNHWKTSIPEHVYEVLVPAADTVSHPMPGDEGLK